MGSGVAEALAGMDGVSGHTVETVDGRTRVELHSRESRELRPEIFSMARERGWSLWELHREKASLEQLFRDLTADDEVGELAAEEGVR